MLRRCLVLCLVVLFVLVPGSQALAKGSNAERIRAELAGLHKQLMEVKSAAEAQLLQARMAVLIQELERDPEVQRNLAELKARLDAKVKAKIAHDLANNDRLPWSTKTVGKPGPATGGAGSAVGTALLPEGESVVVASTVRWDLLRRGDIMHVNNKKFFNLYALYYSHSGIYDGANLVYDSNVDGVRLRPLSDWQQGQPVALGYNNRRTYSERVAALDWAKARYGTDGSTPYNWNFLDKQTDSALYCSQLVWKTNLHLGDDLDSNDPDYAWFLFIRYGLVGLAFAYYAVAPDEIYLSPLVTYYSVGTG
ncbi:MAG: hypothetical protein IMW97_05880 [Firmicutes bacterium]|nr:hypothetical protein [Candidatus Fermentithermobacillaceae bacterium]